MSFVNLNITIIQSASLTLHSHTRSCTFTSAGLILSPYTANRSCLHTSSPPAALLILHCVFVYCLPDERFNGRFLHFQSRKMPIGWLHRVRCTNTILPSKVFHLNLTPVATVALLEFPRPRSSETPSSCFLPAFLNREKSAIG